MKKRIGLILVLFVCAGFFFTDFLTKPTIWSDETLNMQMARNLAEFGRVAIQLAPGQFSSHLYYYTSSTGWVMLASVAAGFKLFGASFFVARSVMALYAFAFLLASYFLLERSLGKRYAALGCLLMATFASFYGNAKSVLGEIPGLFFLALGFLAWDWKPKREWMRFVAVGIGFGLFFATKPAFLTMGAPALFVAHLIAWRMKQLDLKRVAMIWATIALMCAPTIWLGMIHPISLDNTRATATYYSNNYNSPCVSCDVRANLVKFATQTTFFHLDALLFVALIALWIERKKLVSDWRVFWCIGFGALVLLYFIKSPGTNRYLLPLQLILLAVFPVALAKIVHVIRPRFERYVIPCICLLAIVQGVHYVKFSDVYSNPGQPALERYIREELSTRDGLVGVINAPVAGAVVPSDKLIQFVRNNAYDRTDGVNILTQPVESWPPIIIYGVAKSNAGDIDPYVENIRNVYQQRADFGSFVVLSKEP